MKNQEPNSNYTSPARNLTTKQRSSSTNKSIKLKQQKRQAMQQEIKDIDKLKIIALNKLNLLFSVKIDKFLNRAMFMIVGKKETEKRKKYGFVILDGLMKTKRRRAKEMLVHVLKQAVRQRNRIKKYCGRLVRVDMKLQNQKLKQGFGMMINHLKNVKQEQKGVSPPPVSKSVAKKPSSDSLKLNKQEYFQQSVSTENTNSIDNNKMTLSNQFRQSLINIQRYDRVMYISESQKNLKNICESQVKRLQKIKNTNKQMLNNYYDNELTVIVINNLIRSVNELTKQSKNISQMSQQKKQLQKRIIEINQQKSQQIKQIRQSFKVRETQQLNRIKQLDLELKQFGKFSQSIKILYGEGYENNFDKIKKSLQIQSRKLANQNKEITEEKKAVLEIIIELTDKCRQSETNKNNSQFLIKQFSSELSSLIVDEANLNIYIDKSLNDKTLKHLQKQKKLFQTKLKQSQSQDKEYYQNIISLTSQLHTLHYELYLRSAQISELNSKLQLLNNNNSNSQKSSISTDKLKQQQQMQKSRFRQGDGKRQTHKSTDSLRQTKKSPLQQYVRQWTEIVENMIESIKTGDKTWTKDINKKKKWINSHKNNEQLIKLVNNDVVLMNIIAGKEKEDISYQSSPEKEKIGRKDSVMSQQGRKMKDVLKQNQLLSEEIKQLKSRINLAGSTVVSNAEISDIDRVLNYMNKSLLNQEKFQQQSWFDFRNQIKSLISSTPKTKLINVLHTYNHLIQFIESQLESHQQLDEQLKQIASQISTLKGSTKAFSLLANKDSINEQLVSKMKKNLQSTTNKIQTSHKSDSGQLSELNILYLQDTKLKLKLLDIIENQIKTIKQYKQQNISYLLKLKQIQSNRELNQKLNLQNLETINMEQSGRRLQELMKIESSIDDIIEEKDEEDEKDEKSSFLNNRIKNLENQRDSLEQQLQKYRQIFQKYTSQQKLILQRIQQYEQSLSRQKIKTKDYEYKVYDLQSKNRDLCYKYNLVYNQKNVIQNIIEKQSTEKDQLIEQLEMKERVIKELSRDITVLDSKVQRLQQNNQRLDKEKKDIYQRLLEADAVNINLVEKGNEFDQLKDEMTKMIRQSTMKSLQDQQSNINELRLSNENEQYRIMIDQLSKKLEKTEDQKIEVEEKKKIEEERNKKLKLDLDKMMQERQIAFKQYQDIIQLSVKQKQEYQHKLVEKQTQMKKSNQQMGRNLRALEQYQDKVKEDQIKLSRDIQKVVSERLASQQLYYSNLLQVGKTSYEGLIKNQKNQIDRLSKQVQDNTKSVRVIQDLQSQASKLRLEIISANEYRDETMKKYSESLQSIQTLRKQKIVLDEELSLLKTKFIDNVDYQSQFKNQLAQQESYFNDIINSNADEYIKNERTLLSEIESYKQQIQSNERVFKERELTITNQSRQLDHKQNEIEKLKRQMQNQRLDEQIIYQQINKLKQEVKVQQLDDLEDSNFRTKFEYLQKNEYYLRAEIDRLVHQNKVLSKERQRMVAEHQNQSLAMSMKTELRQLQQMFNKLRQQKQIALNNMKNQNDSLAQRCKQREIQLIEQQRLNTSLVHRFQDRQRELIQKINATDTVNRELSDKVQTVREQYHSLKNMINDKGRGQRQESYGRSNLGGSGNEVSLAQKLRLLSFSDGNERNQSSGNNSGRKQRNQIEALNLNSDRQPYSLAESNDIYEQRQRPQSVGVVSEQRYLLLFQENNSLKTKLQIVNLKMRDKEVEIMKLSQNYISLQHQNKYLLTELKQKQRKDSYDINNDNQYITLQSQYRKIKSQNAFLKTRNAYLQNQLKLDKNMSVNRLFNSQQRQQGFASSRQNSMIINGRQTSQEDLLEISILKKISEQVGDLVETNNKLNHKLESLQKQNQILFDTINKISDEGGRDKNTALNAKILVKLNKMNARILEWVNSQQILSEQQTEFNQLFSKLNHHIKKNDIQKYIEGSEQLIQTIIAKAINSKEEVLEEQAQQLIVLKQKLAEIVNDQIEQINSYAEGREQEQSIVIEPQQKLDEVGLLLRAYEKTKNPKLMTEVDRLLKKRNKNRNR